MCIILLDYKYCDVLKIVNIVILYDRCELFFLKFFNEIVYINDYKLVILFLLRFKCRKLRNNRIFDILICKIDCYKKFFIISYFF